VKEIQVGDRVVLLANDNWAQRRKVPLAAVHKVPVDADVQQMAMLKVNPATATMLLDQFVALETSDWIIQNAPLSSVGECVTQLAKIKGIRTVNIVRRPESIARVLELGGDVALEDGPDLAARVEKATRNAPIKLSLDAVAGPGIQRMAECLTEGGKIVNYGMLSGEACRLEPDQTIFRGITLVGFWLSRMLNRLSLHERRTLFDSLAQWMMEGKLKIDVDTEYPFSRVIEAIHHAEQPRRNGKIIVRLDSSETDTVCD
jgi:NADPH:quinone reductase-like Zn-dependent oxidoreductase